MTTLTWKINFDWTTAGTYDTRNDAKYATGLRVMRGRTQYIAAAGNGFEPMTPGYCTITLDNSSGDYDPYNTSGALYPNVAPGKYVRVLVNTGGADIPVFAGRVESIEPTGGVSNPAVIITAYDGLKQLQDMQITTNLHTNIRTGEAVDEILSTAAQWPSVWSTRLESGADIIPYWWENDISAMDAIDRISQAEFGGYAVLADGTFRFKARGLSSGEVATFDQSVMLKDIQVPMPYNVVRNVIKVVVHPKVAQTTAALWTLQDKPYVAGSGSLEVWGNYTYEGRAVGAINTIQPVATTDYTMNTASDGTGTNLTANFSVTATYFAETVKNVIENTGTTGGYVTLLKNRGQAIDTPDTSYVLVDTSGTNLKRTFIIDTPWMQSTTKAKQFADYLTSVLSGVNKFPVFQMESQPDYQFTPDLLDRVTVTISKYSINTSFRVGGIEHEWLTENGQAVRTTVYTEPFVTQSAEDGYWYFTMTFPPLFPY